MNPKQRVALSVGTFLAFGWLMLSQDWATDFKTTKTGVETHTDHFLTLGPTFALILATAALVRLLRDPSGVDDGTS